MERGEGGKRNCFDPGSELLATEREEEGRAKMINGMRKKNTHTHTQQALDSSASLTSEGYPTVLPHTPMRRFSKLDCWTTNAVPIVMPNDTSTESSRQHAYADLFGSDTLPTADVSSMENRPRGA